MRVLVAEDNAVNRELARHLLAQLGHEAVFAHNGREVLARLEEQPCDLILMDLWMPELDGLATCLQIRANERQTGRRIPIIALTANAIKGDRDACLAAGMDEYLVKPVRRQLLADAIQRVAPSGAPAPPERPASASLLAPWEGVDAAILFRLGPMMVDSTKTSLKEMRLAFNAQDWARLGREAHTLKGSLGLFHAPQVVATTGRLEEAARRRDMSALPTLLAALEEQVETLQTEVLDRCAVT
jgi:CheY-like chemotaxis protein/HPt (histidine-containing phosphotransfer) domain-containing protein